MAASNTKKQEWISVSGINGRDLSALLERRIQEKISKGEYSTDDIQYVSKLKFGLCLGSLDVDQKQLEMLRRLCQLWDVDFKSTEITSHRKFIGPIIVAAKKVLFPIFRAFFKETLKQQRDFNAAVIAYLANNSSREGAQEQAAGEERK